MIYPDRMFVSTWITDVRLRRLKPQVQLLLIFLRPLCDRNGRFGFNPAHIHMALYASAECGNISVRDVGAWLEILRSGDFIKTYTGADGRRVGEVASEYWRQKLKFGRDHFEAEPDQPELMLPAADPPNRRTKPRPERKEVKRGECEGARGAPPETHTHTHFSIESIRKRWPSLNVDAEVKDAQAYVRKNRSASAQLDLRWFEEHWLKRSGEKLPSTLGAVLVIEEEPEAWRVYLKDTYPDESWASSAAACTWETMPGHWRTKIVREMTADRKRGDA